MGYATRISSGLPHLDHILDDLRIGDNVVWQVDSVQTYALFCDHFRQASLQSRKEIIYFRFGHHPSLLSPLDHPLYHEIALNPAAGFESFTSQIFTTIASYGEEAHYIFDCLSDLLTEWSADLMIGNFFTVTCPYLYIQKTVAYFAILQDYHSFQTIRRIRDTTQLFINANHHQKLHVHPLKVWQRQSPTMFRPHVLSAAGDSFLPLSSSAAAADAAMLKWGAKDKTHRQIDHWDRIFLKASEIMENAAPGDPAARYQEAAILEQLLKMLIGQDEKLLKLAARYFTIKDLLGIKQRLIGSGYIGGKAVGLLLSRAILASDNQTDWSRLLEPHDSFYIGSDVFYTYLVENNCWQLRQEQRQPERFLTVAPEIRDRILAGSFSPAILDQFHEMLEYFGQSPIIVRSSSLLEDGFGNSFAGKYLSEFCVNQGTPADRLEAFIQAVKNVYASTLSEDALAYREQRGLVQRDEQMALLVQRVSGKYQGPYFLPDLAGVALSHNLYLWKPELDASAGALRVVVGLGTRAVNRTGDDYARLVALDQPSARIESGAIERQMHSQREVDVIDVQANTCKTLPFAELVNDLCLPDKYLISTRWTPEDGPEDASQWLVELDGLLTQTDFPSMMRRLLKILNTAYDHPVDTEFTCNFTDDRRYLINLLQCRPLPNKTNRTPLQNPAAINPERIVFQTGDAVGGNRDLRIERLVWVNPLQYAQLNQSDKSLVARIIGRINRLGDPPSRAAFLVGPGRWGTTEPSLGIPVTFAEINRFSALAELAFTTSGFSPDLSFGTHFFLDLIESDIFYLMLNETEGCAMSQKFITSRPNHLVKLLPETDRWQEMIRVIDLPEHGDQFWIHANIPQRRIIGWIATG